jgi:peptidoglycan-associated lipoprotein
MSQSAVFKTATVLMVVGVVTVGCGKNPPVVKPAAGTVTPASGEAPTTTTAKPPAPPTPVPEPIRVPPEPLRDDNISSASLDDLNRSSPLKPVFFELDSSEVTPEGQAVLNENGAVLKRNATWTITIEGHCDERGTAEYNLALGERRAVAARAYLISLGLSADRLRTVSYGKEFPFEPGHDEASMAKNRRAHFVITAK